MATYIIFQDGRTDFPNSRNTFSVDGSTAHKVLGNMSTYYKLDRGSHDFVITSANGQQWEISEYVGSSDCLNIKIQIDGDSNIVAVAHKVAPEPGTAWMMTKKAPK